MIINHLGYVREYLSKRLNPEDFCRHVEEQMAAYEEMEEKVPFHSLLVPNKLICIEKKRI